MNNQRTYIAIDLKSFYASVECVSRGYDPLRTNLVVADNSRTEKTICLAVSPSLKFFGIPGRPRLFEVVSKVKEVNAMRLAAAPGRKFREKSFLFDELENDSSLEISYIVAPPRMAEYMKISTDIYNIYLKYIAPEDIHVYSIDEVFMDVTDYLPTYKLTPHELAMKIIQDVLANTGITATAGIGTNMYLCKVAMDIVAKHIPPDKDGVRIAELDEMSYRRLLWDHRPLTDFWRVGRGYAKKLEANHLYTMGDIARCSLGKKGEYYSEDLLYKLFGVNAELLIDHAWGWEPTRISDIKSYKPQAKSIGSGQVLHYPYDIDRARVIVREMTELLALDLVEKKLVTNQIVLTVGYDIESLKGGKYHGEITEDRYGRQIPKHAHGTAKLNAYTASTKKIMEAVMELYDRIMNPDLLVRRVNIAACEVKYESDVKENAVSEQMSLFDTADTMEKREQEDKDLEREHKMQQAMIAIKKKYGKNAILKGTNFREGATTIDRNSQIGGHKA
ncbi:MAG: DNA methylase [Clostridia bacterium]|nr:DNA methylase [Clostridia bacterium]